MSDHKEEVKATDELSEKEIEGVQGGRAISLIERMPNSPGPKMSFGSPAAGEINSDSADNNLPDSNGGRIIA